MKLWIIIACWLLIICIAIALFAVASYADKRIRKIEQKKKAERFNRA